MKQLWATMLGAFIVCYLSVHSLPVLAQISVSYVYDGDTVKINDGLREYKLRIADIDAPEKNQRYGKQARRALIKLCKDAEIEVTFTGVDKYQRDLGYLICDTFPVSQWMVEHGYAWFNVRYSSNWTLQTMENEARQSKRGLWKQKKPMPPWIWRQKHAHN
jgi:endonuclease YncB( thermonuclease family)